MKKSMVRMMMFAAALGTVLLFACADRGVVTGGDDAAGGTAGTGGGTAVLELAETPLFVEPFTSTAFAGLYYNNLNWVASIAGITGGCAASMDRIGLHTTVAGDTGNGFMSFRVDANQLTGAEVKTMRRRDYHYGLYEARMKITPVPGCVNAFFWQAAAAGTDGMEEIDIEFLTKESDATSGVMRCTIHPKPDNQGHLDPLHQQLIDLDFSPSADFHVYGFNWTEDLLIYYVDWQEVCRFVRSEGAVIPTSPGLIWINVWTGAPSFGGGPPTEDATMYVDWVKYWPDETSTSGIGIDLSK